MKKILVPTDFSDASQKAVNYAIEFAETLDAKITFLKAYHFTPYSPEMYVFLQEEEIEELKLETEKHLQKVSSEANRRTKHKSDYMVEEGQAVPTILSAMEELKPDLTIMGTQGMSALERTVFGSNTLEVARNAQYPLMVVPEKARYSGIDKIIYATDYHDSDIEALKYLATIAEKTDAEIVVLHVADGDVVEKFEESYLEEFESIVRESIKLKKLRFEMVEDDHIASAIEKFAEDEKADLISISRWKRSLFLKIFIPSITKKMIYHTDIPLLIFNAWDIPSEDF